MLPPKITPSNPALFLFTSLINYESGSFGPALVLKPETIETRVELLEVHKVLNHVVINDVSPMYDCGPVQQAVMHVGHA